VTAKEEYVRALYTLSKSTPPEVWEKFVSALVLHSSERMEQLISAAALEDAQGIIGFVRCIREFRDEFKNIEATHQKMDKEQENKGMKRERPLSAF
jgi:hypothetical protein